MVDAALERPVNLAEVEGCISQIEQRLADSEGPARQAVVDQELPVATELYAERHDALSPAQRARLMDLLIAFDDSRTLPAFKVALAQLLRESGERPEELFALLRAYETGRVPFLASALLEIYPKFRAHTASSPSLRTQSKKRGHFVRDSSL